ncbi:MAG: TetR/AcrR family transcriptional regulator [Rhodospirillales bacterium]|jgi:AcrR family transcriptional regulator
MGQEAMAAKSSKASISKGSQIRAAAGRLFLSQGYAATSMDSIATAAGVSKATLYAHFRSKQLLFESMVQERFRAEMEENLKPLQLGDDPFEGLAAVGRRFLALLMSPDALAVFRLVLAESVRLPELGEAFYRSGPARTLEMVTAYIEYLNERGRLRVEDTALGADQFLGMLKNKGHMKCLLGLAPLPSAADIDLLARAAARLFVAGNAPARPKL